MRVFRSVRFNILLFLVIAGASALGTFVPQAAESPERVEQWLQAHPASGRLFEALGLFQLYGSWWYLGLLALMAFDIVACKLAKAPPDPGLVSLPPELAPEAAGAEFDRAEAALAGKPFGAEWTSAAGAGEAAAALRGALGREGYRVHPGSAASDGERASFVATRHRAQRWGSTVAHAALVAILLGGVVKQRWGFTELVPVLEGEAQQLQNRPDWRLHLDRFTVRYYEGTRMPSFFSSQLKVTRGDRVLGEKLIRVNDPLAVGGVRFHQASWGAGGLFRSATLELGRTRLSLPQRRPTLLPGTGIEVLADAMLPSFTVREDGRAGSDGAEPDAPAVRVLFRVGGKHARPLWLLRDHPDVAFYEGDDGVLSRAHAPPFRLAGVEPVLFSGIQVSYDPGYPVVLAGALAWLAGMMLLFWLHRRRLWVVIGPSGEPGRSRVRIAAWSSRGGRDFKPEFDGLIRRLVGSGRCQVPGATLCQVPLFNLLL